MMELPTYGSLKWVHLIWYDGASHVREFGMGSRFGDGTSHAREFGSGMRHVPRTGVWAGPAIGRQSPGVVLDLYFLGDGGRYLPDIRIGRMDDHFC